MQNQNNNIWIESSVLKIEQIRKDAYSMTFIIIYFHYMLLITCILLSGSDSFFLLSFQLFPPPPYLPSFSSSFSTLTKSIKFNYFPHNIRYNILCGYWPLSARYSHDWLFRKWSRTTQIDGSIITKNFIDEISTYCATGERRIFSSLFFFFFSPL